MMMNRLIKCISLAKIPLNIQPRCTILRGVCKIPINSNLGIISYDFSSSKKGFCSVSAEKLTNIKDNDDLSDTAQSSSSAENKNDNKTEEEIIPDELKAAMEADPALYQRYKILQLEVDVHRQTGKEVPSKLLPHHWLQLLTEPTRTSRRRYLRFLFITEKKQENSKKKQAAAREKREMELKTSPAEENDYRLHKISMFLRIYDTTMNHFYHSRLIHAMQFGEKLVIDCGFHKDMTARESIECAKQIAYMFAQNRLSKNPFDLRLYNVDKSSLLMQRLHRSIPTLYDPEFPLNISEKSYLESFDKDKLVYLTPHCQTEMENYELDSVYIIGAIVDMTNSNPLSLAKAKEEKLRMAKLPLNKYLLFGAGSGKRLPLNQMVNILRDIKITGDWNIAFKHVPKRKLEKDIKNNNENDGRVTHKPQRNYNNFNNEQFRPHQDKIQNSFTFKNRQQKTFNKY